MVEKYVVLIGEFTKSALDKAEEKRGYQAHIMTTPTQLFHAKIIRTHQKF